MSLPEGPWAILRSHFDRYLMDGADDLQADADPGDIAAMYAARSRPRQGGVAVVPVLGPITKRDSAFSLLFGGTSTNRLIAELDALATDESVSAVVLNVDSPGGTISGVPEAAEAVRRLAAVKPVTAISNDLMASAAYWIASGASEIMTVPEALTGSIGVFAAHLDMSEALEKDGLKVTLISSSPEKVEGNEFAPLDDEAREHIQGLVDSAMDLFVADVARGRGVTPNAVRKGFGKGRVLDAAAAKEAGLVDRIGTFPDALARAPKAKRRAEVDLEMLAEGASVGSVTVTTALEVETDEDRKRKARRLEVDLDKWRFARSG